MQLNEFNVASNSQNEIEAWLSNLSYNPFTLDWILYASIEAFWQSLKFEKWSEEWNECITLSWIESKKYWNKAEKKETFIYFWIEYKVWSEKHQKLMKQALREQLKQNPDKLKLLLSTWNLDLVHRPKREDGTYYPDSITIPWYIFSRFLIELRQEFNKINIVSKEKLLEEADNYAWSFIKILRDWHKIDIADYRRFEPDIDLMLNLIIDDIFSFSWYKERGLVIKNDFILDDIAISYIKKDNIEWLDMSFEELAKKLWDLFYEPLASVLNSISIELDKQIDSNEEVIRLIKEASIHILKAWDHCKPYVTDINELEKNSKHTFVIEWTNLSNEKLAKSIAYLEDRYLKEFLVLLSIKINRDWVADEWRKRIKLATELYACANKLKQASEE